MTQRNKKVVIIGAGCAGLSAGYELMKQGVDFVLYEASNRVGGRCREDWEEGHHYTAGAGSTEPQWDVTWQYIRELGLEDRIYTMDKQHYNFVFDGKDHHLYMGDGAFMRKNLVKDMKFLLHGFGFKSYWQILKAFKVLSPYMKGIDQEKHDYEALAEISDMSTEEFCEKNGVPLASKWFFGFLLEMMVLARPCEISIAHPISLFALMQGMCNLRNGLGEINDKIYEQISDKVKLGTPVDKVVIEDGKVTGVVVNGECVEADQVIIGTDVRDLFRIAPDLPASMKKALDTVEYSSSYIYQFYAKNSRVNGGNHVEGVDLSNCPMHTTIIRDQDTFINFIGFPNENDRNRSMGIYTRGWMDDQLANMSDEERLQKVLKEARRFVPEFPTEFVHMKAYRWDRAVNTEPPGQYNAIRDMLANHMDDVAGLHLAGEYLFLIACTEGAWRTGKEAAEKVASQMK